MKLVIPRMKLVIPIVLLVIVTVLVGCPAAEVDPAQGVRDTFDQGLAYIRAGEYDQVWTLYSVEFREKIAAEFQTQKNGMRNSIANQAFDVDKWAMAQTGMTAKQYLAATPQEILAARLEIARNDVLRSRIDGKINIEGDLAYVRIVFPPADEPADYQFIHRNGRWLFYDRSFMPAK